MRKIILTVFTSLLSFASASAFWPEAADSAIEIGAGYRVDTLKFHTEVNQNSSLGSSDDYYGEGQPQEPNKSPDDNYPIMSSFLDWKKMNVAFIEGRAKYVTCDQLYFRGNGDFGWITSGKNSDTDFEQFESYSADLTDYSKSKTKGHVYDVNAAVGYQFQLCDDTFTFAPLIGYSWKGQHLKDRSLKVLGDYSSSDWLSMSSGASFYSASGSKKHVNYNSKYHTRWNGPFIGFDSVYRFNCDWSVFADYEYHWGEYRASALWAKKGLRFSHHSKSSYGHSIDAGLKWEFCECWTASIHGSYQYFRANHGRDKTYQAHYSRGDLDADLFTKIPLKKVEWHSASVAFNLGMVF